MAPGASEWIRVERSADRGRETEDRAWTLSSKNHRACPRRTTKPRQSSGWGTARSDATTTVTTATEKGTDLFILFSRSALLPIFDPPPNDCFYFANESFGSRQLPPLQRFADQLPLFARRDADSSEALLFQVSASSGLCSATQVKWQSNPAHRAEKINLSPFLVPFSGVGARHPVRTIAPVSLGERLQRLRPSRAVRQRSRGQLFQ